MRFLTVLSSLLFSLSLNAQSIADYKTTQSGVTFTENKGQVSDQHYNPRPDVLYSGNSGGLNFHIRTDGISYQMTRIDSWKEDDMGLPEELAMPDGASQPKDSVIDQMTIYRTDINWIGARSNFEVETGRAKQGYNNYYLPTCPDGALNVLSYDEVTFKNLYEGIDLKWYSNEGALEYDFIVSPNTDYSQIKWEIQGAEQIAIGQEGQLIISTPLGKIEEQAPIAYQGKQEVEVEWTLTENQVGFSVKDYNQELPLRIDPVVRVWGTYIGDTSSIYGDDYVNGIDLIQNKVYCVGSTNSTSNIATTGSYQVSFLGVQDAFINSFNHYGEREWGTYYGGAATDLGLAISAHLEGIYVVGNTNSNSNIATTGAFQSQNGEGYLMKFDSTGQKLWGTYYGFNCSVNSVKASEEGVYVVGRADNGNTSFYVSTGAYQTSFGGGTDGFIAKFSHSGNRVWGSLFGSSGDEGLEKVDILNEVLAIVGSTSSSSGIASSGAHQTTYGGDLSDAMIAILDTSGIFLWSSYLGGSARDYGNGVAIGSDSSIVLSGVTNSENNLSTVGSHQEVKSGYYDAFISKFAFDGSLSWSTYYGGFNYEGKTKTEINNGSIFIFGNTNSYGIANNAISSTNSYQEEGLGADAYFAKFSSSGERLFGSYYGGTGADYGSGGGCVNEQTILIAGYTVSNNGIASSGSHQEILGGGYDGFIARFDCEASNDTLFVSGCEFYETPFGDTAFQSGVLKYLFYDVYGCDSVIRFDITIFNSDSTIDHQEACGEFTWIDGNTYTSNNNSAQFTLSSVNGCDSVVTLDLTILNADTSVTSSPPSLEANADSATYQWIDCSTSLPIDSATSQVFVAQNNGSYAVVVTQNGCTDTSSCYQINNVGMESLNGIEASVFPNPSSNNITIQCSGEFDFKVLSIDGKTVLSRSGLDAVNCELAEFPRGQYTIVVSQAGKANQYKVILN